MENLEKKSVIHQLRDRQNGMSSNIHSHWHSLYLMKSLIKNIDTDTLEESERKKIHHVVVCMVRFEENVPEI